MCQKDAFNNSGGSNSNNINSTTTTLPPLPPPLQCGTLCCNSISNWATPTPPPSPSSSSSSSNRSAIHPSVHQQPNAKLTPHCREHHSWHRTTPRHARPDQAVATWLEDEINWNQMRWLHLFKANKPSNQPAAKQVQQPLMSSLNSASELTIETELIY